MSEWLNDYYDDVDHMRLENWLARHTDDVVVQFGNNPPARGTEDEDVEQRRRTPDGWRAVEHRGGVRER